MLPARPVLRPGVPVVRRDDRHLQVGLDPPRCVVLPDEPAVRRVLGRLRGDGVPLAPTAAEARVVERLARAGMLDDLDEQERRRAARDAVTVGYDGPPDLERAVTDRLRDVGLATGPDPDASVVLVLRDGAVPRRQLDRCVRDGTPHLVVAAEADAVSIGPFVDPGRTACQRCVDAHVAALDPRRSLLLEQTATTVPRSAALHPLALGWAVADLLAWAEGRQPSTWSATVRLDADLDHRRTLWRRHPSCGCAWDVI